MGRSNYDFLLLLFFLKSSSPYWSADSWYRQQGYALSQEHFLPDNSHRNAFTYSSAGDQLQSSKVADGDSG